MTHKQLEKEVEKILNKAYHDGVYGIRFSNRKKCLVQLLTSIDKHTKEVIKELIKKLKPYLKDKFRGILARKRWKKSDIEDIIDLINESEKIQA